MRIDQNIKLDFSDVLIKPKRSYYTSRREVDLNRKFVFKWSDVLWTGIPIVAANMDTVGTIQTAKVMSNINCLTFLHKFNTIEDIDSLPIKTKKNVAVTIGVSKDNPILKSRLENIEFICIDVANGYTEQFSDFVSFIRELYPTKIIIAGNVCTPEMTEQLILSGADIVKVGIGGGCFSPKQPVKTTNGLKNIEEIEIGEKVLTHKGRYKTVTNTFKFEDKKTLIKVNDIKCTPNHEFFVLNKKYKSLVNDENIHEYAEWICANDLNTDFVLLKGAKYQMIEITELETIDYDGTTYDLEVEEDHSYNIDGILVHNSACTTRKVAGIGIPQLSAVIECTDAAHGIGGMVMSDGGCTCSGDISKAFGANADFVMLGGLLAGHTENIQNIMEDPATGEKIVEFYGMASNKALDKYYSENKGKDYKASEGKLVTIPYRGSLENTMLELLGGVRSTCTYIGAKKIKDISKCTTFVRVNNQINNIFS